MGQKVNPRIFRIGITKTWSSKWFAKKNYSTLLKEDVLIRKFIRHKLKDAWIDEIGIERFPGNVNITIHSAKPGLMIGRGGAGIENLKNDIVKKFLKETKSVNVNVQEIAKPNLSAAVVMQGMIADLEKRMPFRRVLKQAVSRVTKAGAKGVKVSVAGRLNGAEIARTEKLGVGKVPLHTLRADIDYCRGFAQTIFGSLGVKVWIYRGDIFPEKRTDKTKQGKL